MHFLDVIADNRPTFSFEFFPPRTGEAADELFERIRELELLRPSFVSVTCGAGGSTRELTRGLVAKLMDRTDLNTVPHLTCAGHSEQEIDSILGEYAAHGVANIVALRGDRPPGSNGESDRFRYAAQLVAYIRKFGESGRHRDPRGFGIAVAGYPEGHPETPHRVREMDHLKVKVDSGADLIITQLFFENRDFYDFRDRCRLSGIRAPIIAGIMPITSMTGMKRMAELALGMRYPAPLIRAMNRTNGDAEGVRRVGVHWATEQCRDLLDHDVDGIHFYTLNKSRATRSIYESLGVRDSRGLR